MSSDAIRFARAIPILRICNEAKARGFYCGFPPWGEEPTVYVPFGNRIRLLQVQP